jgi:plastocyanin
MDRVTRVVVLCLLFASGCSKSSTEPPAATPQPEAAPAPAGGVRRVVGRVPPSTPENPPIVVLEPKTSREFPPPADKSAMDQVSLTFIPPLLFVRTNHPTEFRNSDDTLHNVHVTHEETREPQFNVAIPTGEVYNYTFKRDGFYHVGCDIHPAMAAEIFASASPYVTTADERGSFSFDDVEPGMYAMTVYSSGKRMQKDVEVKDSVTNVAIE